MSKYEYDAKYDEDDYDGDDFDYYETEPTIVTKQNKNTADHIRYYIEISKHDTIPQSPDCMTCAYRLVTLFMEQQDLTPDEQKTCDHVIKGNINLRPTFYKRESSQRRGPLDNFVT